MQKPEARVLSLGAVLVVAALFATGNVAAQSNEPETRQRQQAPPEAREQGQMQEQAQAQVEEEPAVPARPSVPRVTGTVTRWTGNRIDLKTREGKMQKVAVNRDTERLVDVKAGIEVTVEYRRRISGFVIARRVLAAETEDEDPGKKENGTEQPKTRND